MSWLDQHSGAVQAITAIVVAVATVALIALTAWYATLTRRMALTMERQLAASFQPAVELRLDNLFQGHGSAFGTESENISGTIIVENKGSVPIKIVTAAMKIVFPNGEFSEHHASLDAQHRVVAPDNVTRFRQLIIDVPIGSSKCRYEQIAQVHCSDLAGISKHTFSLSSEEGSILNHSVGFQPISSARS